MNYKNSSEIRFYESLKDIFAGPKLEGVVKQGGLKDL